MSDYFLGCLMCCFIGYAVAALYAQGRFSEAIMLLAAWS
jgi:hypothetical protein